MWLAPSGECCRRVLDGGRAALAGADADGFLDRADEDLAVADASGVGRLLDGLHRALDQLVLQDDLDFHLGQEIDDVFGAAVELGMAFLARSEEHTSELQSLMRISYAVFCLKKKNKTQTTKL